MQSEAPTPPSFGTFPFGVGGLRGFGAAELRTFAAVAETLLPGTQLEDGRDEGLSARRLGLASRLTGLAAGLPHETERVALRAMLLLLGSRAGGLALHGTARAFEDLGPTEAEAAFRAMSSSPRLKIRQVAVTLRRVVATLAATARPGERHTPVWDVMGYPGPLGPPPDEPRRLSPVTVDRPSTWTCDVVVIGSGAGGGVAAAVLAEAGLDVVVLERGEHREAADFSHLQHEADRDLYATRLTADLGTAVFTGQCLGGGTVVNYATSLPTPAEVRAEWDREAGFSGVFEGAEYQRSLDAVSARLGVTCEQSQPWARDRLLEAGMNALGWRAEVLPRNVRGCPQDERCGYCNFGCRLGAKQSTLRTWLEDASDAGARLVVRAEAEQLVLEGGRAVGVRAKVRKPSGKTVPLSVFGRAVVVACGAMFTPVLLQRSRIAGEAIGRYLRLHPVTGVWGRFEQRTDPWGGVMQARLGAQFADLDGRGHGVRFESGAIHPVEFLQMQGWAGAADHARVLRSYRHWAPIAVLLRERGWGTVRARKVGPPVWDYALDAYDVRHVRQGVQRAAQALAAAGAREVRSVQHVPAVWRPSAGEPLGSFMGRVDAGGFGACQTIYGSYHPTGSARMGSDPRLSAVDEENQVHGVPGLFVLDGSCFPTASGVNPMLSIEAIAHRGARALAARLSRPG